MATTAKRAWKLQEFTAHAANVNCMALGGKSGRVLVTGGDDRKVNLWAVGKPTCIMSLSGHTTAVEAVRFSPTEELVCAGSAAGAVKVWDLEAARMVRTLTGHRAGIRSLDFHPYGDFLATGSADTNIKLWDIRRKGCIFTYKGHSMTVNSLRFSPDGQWVASAGDDGAVKMWDLRAGRLLSELRQHTAPVTEVEFHPHEFLLASGAADRRVLFWDLENFSLVSDSQPETNAIRSIYFHPEGKCLFSAAQDGLRVYGWEPCRTFDCVPLPWGRIQDMAVTSSQLIGVSYNLTYVSVYVVDLKKVAPFATGGAATPHHEPSSAATSFRHGATLRKSFNRERTVGARIQMHESSHSQHGESDEKSSTETEEDAVSLADIPDLNNYHDVFQPRDRELSRTPPPLDCAPSDNDVQPDVKDKFDPTAPQVIRPPPPDLVQQHTTPQPAPQPTPLGPGVGVASAHSPQHRPSPSPSPPYRGGGGGVGVGRSGAAATSTTPTSALRERRNSTSSVTSSASTKMTSALDRGHSDSIGSNLNHVVTSPRPDVTHGHGPTPQHPTPSTAVAALLTSSSSSVSTSTLHRGRQTQRATGRKAESIRDVLQPSLSDHDIPPKTGNMRHSPSEPALHQPPGRSLSTSRSSSLTRPGAAAAAAASHRPDVASSSTPPPPPSSSTLAGRHAHFNNNNNNHINRSSHNGHHSPLYGAGHGPASQATPPPLVQPFGSCVISDRPAGLDLDDFLPRQMNSMSVGSGGFGSRLLEQHYQQQLDTNLEQTELESCQVIAKGHQPMMIVLSNRHRNLQVVYNLWQNKDAKVAVETAVNMNDQAVIVDLLSVIIFRPFMWNLDLCVLLLPAIGDLLQSKFESYVTIACNSLRLILKNFGGVIKTNIESPMREVGVDISRHERYNKCMSCYSQLVPIKAFVLKRQAIAGKLGQTFRELQILLQIFE